MTNKPDAVGVFRVDGAEHIGDLVRGNFNTYRGRGGEGGEREIFLLN